MYLMELLASSVYFCNALLKAIYTAVGVACLVVIGASSPTYQTAIVPPLTHHFAFLCVQG